MLAAAATGWRPGMASTATVLASVAVATATRWRMVGLHLLLMKMLQRLLLLGVALRELLLLHHVSSRVRLFQFHPLLLEVLHLGVMLLMHRGDLLRVFLFLLILFLMVLRVGFFQRIQLRVMFLLHGLELLGVLARDFLLLLEPLPVERLHFLIVLP